MPPSPAAGTLTPPSDPPLSSPPPPPLPPPPKTLTAKTDLVLSFSKMQYSQLVSDQQLVEGFKSDLCTQLLAALQQSPVGGGGAGGGGTSSSSSSSSAGTAQANQQQQGWALQVQHSCTVNSLRQGSVIVGLTISQTAGFQTPAGSAADAGGLEGGSRGGTTTTTTSTSSSNISGSSEAALRQQMTQLTTVLNQKMGSLVNLLVDGTALDRSFQQRYATGSTAVGVLQWEQAVVVDDPLGSAAGAKGGDASGTRVTSSDPSRAKMLIGSAVGFGGVGVLVALGATVYFIRQRRQWSQQGLIQPSVMKAKAAAAAAAAAQWTRQPRSSKGAPFGPSAAESLARGGGTPAGDQGDNPNLGYSTRRSKGKSRTQAAISSFDDWWQQQQRVQQQPPQTGAAEDADDAASSSIGRVASPIELPNGSPVGPVTPRVRQGPGTRRSAWLVDSLHSSAISVAPHQGASHPSSGTSGTGGTHRVAWAAGVTDGPTGPGLKRQVRRNLSAAVIRDDQLLEVLRKPNRVRAVPLVG